MPVENNAADFLSGRDDAFNDYIQEFLRTNPGAWRNLSNPKNQAAARANFNAQYDAGQTTAEANARLDEQTSANRPNQETPFGSVRWEQETTTDPVTGEESTQWTQNTTLAPDQQASLDARNQVGLDRNNMAIGMMGGVNDALSNPMDFDQYGQYQDLEFDPNQIRQQAEDASYLRSTNRLDPRFEQGRSDIENKLLQQGLTPGDAAYDRAMGNFDRSENDAYGQARLAATSEGRVEAGQMMGFQKDFANYGNELINANITRDQTARGQTLNELNSVQSGQQVGMPTPPNFSNSGRGGATDYAGASQQGYDYVTNMNNIDNMNRQTQMAGYGMLLNGASSAGSMMMGKPPTG